MIHARTIVITRIVETSIKNMCNTFPFPFVISVNKSVKFKNGIQARRDVVSIFIMKAIIPGKKEMNVSGVNAL